jgi:hypothetical protein
MRINIEQRYAKPITGYAQATMLFNQITIRPAEKCGGEKRTV